MLFSLAMLATRVLIALFELFRLLWIFWDVWFNCNVSEMSDFPLRVITVAHCNYTTDKQLWFWSSAINTALCNNNKADRMEVFFNFWAFDARLLLRMRCSARLLGWGHCFRCPCRCCIHARQMGSAPVLAFARKSGAHVSPLSGLSG